MKSMNSVSTAKTSPEDRASLPAPKPIGRPTILEAMGLTIEDIVEVYKVQKSLPKTAAVLGIGVNTCKKYLKLAKAAGPRGGRIQPFSWRKRQRTPVYDWFKAHRNDRLPRSSAKLAALSGFTEGQVKKFLYTRRLAATDYLRSLGELPEQLGHAIDVLGRRIPLGMIQDYELKIDTYDLTVRISATLKMGGRVNMLLTFRQYQEIFKREPQI